MTASMTGDQYTDLIQQIAQTETKLTASLNTGLTGINIALANLTEMHHKAQLEQERRNALFATRERLDELIGQVHGHGNKIQTNSLDIRRVDKCTEDLEARLNDLNERVTARTMSFLAGATGYIIMIAIMLLGQILTFTLAHLVH